MEQPNTKPAGERTFWEGRWRRTHFLVQTAAKFSTCQLHDSGARKGSKQFVQLGKSTAAAIKLESQSLQAHMAPVEGFNWFPATATHLC